MQRASEVDTLKVRAGMGESNEREGIEQVWGMLVPQ